MYNNICKTMTIEYNRIAGTRLRAENPENLGAWEALLDALNLGEAWTSKHADALREVKTRALQDGDAKAMAAAARHWAREVRANTPTPAQAAPAQAQEPTPASATPTPAPAPATAQSAQHAQNALDLMGSVITELLAKTKMDDIRAEVMSAAVEAVEQHIRETYGTLPHVTVVQHEDAVREVKGLTHAAFESVVQMVALKKAPYLYGEAGTGKNVLAQQTAEALGLPFFFTGAVNQPYQLLGFIDARGQYQSTQFFEAFSKGGLFFFDEIDASCPEALLAVNAALANGYMDFPCGKVTAHENFRCIAAGNTLGHGASAAYSARGHIDAASLDRFLPILVDYDARIEEAMAGEDKDLLTFCRKLRAAAQHHGMPLIISYRAIKNAHDLAEILPIDQVLQSALIKYAPKDDMRLMYGEVSDCGRWSKALENYVNG